jgi:predicted membrane-bound spermidine synthase
MTSGIIRHFKGTPGHTISVLYFVNSLGGASGVILSGYYLIAKLTLPGTVILAGIIDIIIAAAVLVLCIGTVKKDKQTSSKTVTQPASVTPSGKPSDTITRVMLLLAGATAASSFLYEIAWIRMLSLVLGGSTHAFELMLSAFILGIAIGGFLIRKRLDNIKNTAATLAIIQVVMGVLAIFTLVFYNKIFYLMQFIMASFNRNEQGYLMLNIYSHFLCMLVMLPATICIGMTLPIITSFLYKKTGDESMIGKVYAFNTIGSIIGIIIAVQFLMPLIGLKGLIITGGSIDMLLGVLILWFFREQISSQLKLALPAISIAASVLPILFVHLDPALLTSGVYRSGHITTDREMIFYKDGKTSSVSLHKKEDYYSLAVNGKVDASLNINENIYDADEYTQVLLARFSSSDD